MAELSRMHPKSVNAYENLVGYVFQGRYMGVQQNKSSGTLREVFQVDSNAGNDDLLNFFQHIRHWNSKSYGQVKFDLDSRSASSSCKMMCRMKKLF